MKYIRKGQEREYKRKWYEKNKERLKHDYQLWKLSHYEEYRRQKKKYNDSHKKEMQEWREKNKEYLDEYKKIYDKKHPESVVLRRLRNRAKTNNITFNLIRAEFFIWFKQQSQKCYYCNNNLIMSNTGKKQKQSLSIDRKDNTKGYEKDNIIMCCDYCNTVKNNVLTFEEMRLVGKVLQKIWRKRKNEKNV